jgi:DNA repair exonuclease SbcCD ATPase subunit|tara:strand:+ start:474 stop:2204 length:1731 start_codon:yes stop_codon:yes gene_type:complete
MERKYIMIIFKTLSWKNFLSTGNYNTTVDLTRHDNTLVSGENGAGKSTMLDALTFALFGKSFRGINIPQLVNTINEKDCEVEITFTVGNDDYKIIRSVKPKKFEIYKNDNLIDQDAKAKDYQKILEEQILKMTYKSFCQVVILGSSNYVPFMQLSASDRRLVVENLLDIDVFSVMNTLVKARLQMTKEYIKDIDHKIDLVKNRIEDKEKLILTLEKKSNDSVEKYQKEITENQNHLDDLKTQIENQKNSVSNLDSQINDKDFISNSLIKMEDIEKQIKRKCKNIKKEITFYENNKICPSCNQSILEDHKNKVVDGLREKDGIYENRIRDLEEEIDLKEKRLGDINSIIENINNIEKQISIKQNEVSASLQYIDKIQKNIESILNEGSETQEAKNELNQLIGEGKNHFERRKELIEDKHYYAIASTLLKDSGIKSKIIKHYLPIMNKLINKYLADMDFFCQFNLDENFSETIKSRHRDEFSYHSFSEGERLRIDLSLLLAWREIARLKNSVNCNLLILDEVFDSSLDAVGTEEFLKLLTTFGSRANIFVISHKSDTMTDKFQNHIVFEKKNNFSRIK